MKTQEFKVLGLKAVATVPATADEYDRLAKKADACVTEAVNNKAYRGWHPDVRDTFLHGREANAEKHVTAIPALDELPNAKYPADYTDPSGKVHRKGSPISRLTKTTSKKDAKGNPIEVFAETEDDYFARVCSILGLQRAAFQDRMDSISKEVPFTVEERERVPAKPKKLAEAFAQAGDRALAGMKAKSEKFVKFTKAFEKVMGKPFAPALTGKAEEDRITVGWLIKDYDNAVSAQRLQDI